MLALCCFQALNEVDGHARSGDIAGLKFMKTITTIFVFAIMMTCASVHASDFDDLDKAPEGAHRGQMLAGASIFIGAPFGNMIDAENSFLKNTTYTFANETTKLIQVTHLAFGLGLFYEYMPIDYIGARAKFRRSIIVQTSNFGPDYKNWREYLYTDYSLLFGFTIHATTRKKWDIALTPFVGYAFYEAEALPVASRIVPGFTGDTKRTGGGLAYGVELNFIFYFTGGFFLSLGTEWVRNTVKVSAFDITNPQTFQKYKAKSSSDIDTIGFILSAGYAFTN
jgi:hypothetical protein